MRFLSTLSSQRLSLPISLFPSSREFCRESNVGKMVQPHNHIITCCHGCDKSITQNAGRNRNNEQSHPIPFISTILAGTLLFGSDRQVYALDIIPVSMRYHPGSGRAYFRVVNFVSALNGICVMAPCTRAMSRKLLRDARYQSSMLPFV